jgi:hypothetical protein
VHADEKLMAFLELEEPRANQPQITANISETRDMHAVLSELED